MQIFFAVRSVLLDRAIRQQLTNTLRPAAVSHINRPRLKILGVTAVVYNSKKTSHKQISNQRGFESGNRLRLESAWTEWFTAGSRQSPILVTKFLSGEQKSKVICPHIAGHLRLSTELVLFKPSQISRTLTHSLPHFTSRQSLRLLFSSRSSTALVSGASASATASLASRADCDQDLSSR